MSETPEPTEIEALRTRIASYEEAFRSIILADKTQYRHHEKRFRDGMPPKLGGGTCWLTPRELAQLQLNRSTKGGSK